MSRHRCAGCITDIPLTRRLCAFCTRTAQLAALGRSKQCLRCRHERPLDSFGRDGRFRLCDDCRWARPMTDAEKAESQRLAKLEWKRRARYRGRRAA